MSLNYLATRFTCSWPWNTMVLLCRRPALVRLFRSVRPENSRRRAAVHGERGVDRAGGLGASRGSQRRRIEILRRLPAETAAQERRGGAPAIARRRRAPEPPLHRVHGGLQHLLLQGVLRAGDRHHEDAPGRHAGLRPLQARRGRGGPVAGPHRLLQLRRGVSAQARRGDVRVHQGAVPAHLPLHEHQRPGADAGAARAGWRTRASTK